MASYLILLQQDYYVRSGTVNNIELDILSVKDDGSIVEGYNGANIVSATKDGGDYLAYFKWYSGKLRVLHPDSTTLISSELEAGVYTVEINGGYNSVFVNVHYMYEDFIACDDTCVLSGRFGGSTLPVQTGDDSKISVASISWIEKPSDMRGVEGGFTGNSSTAFSKSHELYLRNWCYAEGSTSIIGGDNLSGAERIWKAVVSRGDASRTITFTQELYGNLYAEVIYSTPVIELTKMDGYKPVYVEMALSNFPYPEYMSLVSVEAVDGEVSEVKSLDFGYIKSNRFYAIIGVKDDGVLSEGYHSVKMVLRNIDSNESITVETSFEVALPFTVDIPSEIEEETDYQITITYPTGNELVFNTPDDVIITIDAETDNGNGITTATGTIRVNEENTASQITISISDGTNTITKTITILDKEPPMAAPTISINKYADLFFPQEGGTKYITITYENTLLAYINQPVAAAAIQIKAESTTETDTGVQIYYSITVPSTTMRREIPLTFSCLSPSGLSCTETYYAVQEGQTETDDYCWINAFPVHLTFEAIGGTQRIQVRAGYPDVDNPIKAKVRNSKIPSINISWCTANFVSREYSDDYTEVTEQWDIVMDDHSQFTEPFMADITFSYTNSYGDSASYGCTATVKGGDGEEQASEIEAYRTVMRFDANGVFDYSDATCTVAYHWIDEVDIEDPVVSADWIVVTEGTHKSTAGKIEIPWHIAVGKNTSPNERTGTVTFSAIGMNDEELSVTMTVMQGGADVKDETLEYVDLLWKDCEVELGDDDMTFEILDESYDVFYTGRCQKRPLGEKNTFLINKIVQDYVWMEEIPALLNGTAEYQEHVNGYRKFRLDTPDTVGAMRSFYFKYDWSYQEGSPFVLSESIIPYVVEGQKNMITYCNLDYNNSRTDIYTWIKSNGSVENGAISADNEEYATKVITMPENADYYVLGGQRYEVLSPCRAKYVLYYLSPKGGWCWFPIMGKVKSSDRLTTYTLSSNYNNTTTQFGKKRYTVDIATDYDLSTGWLTESQSLRMWEMLESNMVYLHDMEKDVIFPVLMRQDTVEKKNVNRGERKMISYTFGVETSQGKMRI